MKKSEYIEKSATAEGRKNLHTELLSEIKKRMDLFTENAPEANRAKVTAMFDRAMDKMKDMGNSTLFDFFADEECRDIDFIRYTQQVITGKF